MKLTVNRYPYTALGLVLVLGSLRETDRVECRRRPKPLGPRMSRKGKSGEIPNTGKGYR